MFLDAFLGAFAANALIGVFVYGCWRLNRNDVDWKAYAMVIGSAGLIGLAGLASISA